MVPARHELEAIAPAVLALRGEHADLADAAARSRGPIRLDEHPGAGDGPPAGVNHQPRQADAPLGEAQLHPADLRAPAIGMPARAAPSSPAALAATL